ncbi:YfhO family protein [Streptomyces sp. NPDC014734]|uniref:YfhO family protein n=1 Tax=Streptomyces sp. NPDC014734 TaxID=3364886 RepID=UPI0036F9AC43
MPTSRPRLRAGSLAALLTVAAVCAGDAAARSFPFGSRTRSINDLGNQFVPFHARLWDLLHGNADGGLLFNWSSGFGTSFLPDLGTYLTSPFALLVGVFPRDRIDLAVYVVTVLKMSAAAAVMAALLLTLRGGRWWAAGVLGGSYALCGWSVIEASSNPMWLDGLIALPLLCLAGEWARTGRHRVAAPLLVALAWAANFYTAYMATLGAALVLAVRLFTERADRPEAPRGPGLQKTLRGPGRAEALRGPGPAETLRGLGRAVATVVLGIGIAAPVLLPVYLGTRHAYPGWTRSFGPAAWADVFARLLPATYSFFTPALFLGTGTLLPAAALAFQRSVPRRERWVWPGLVVGVALSLQWEPTHLLWHAFATPNGSPYRQTFVLAGIVVIAAWISVAHAWPDRRALLGGAAVVGLIAAGAGFSDLVTLWTYPLFAAGLVAAVAALTLVTKGRRYAVLAAVLLIGAQAGQAAATTAYGDWQKRRRLDHYAPWGERQRARAAAVADVGDWPRHRTDPGRLQATGNDPLLVGGQGGGYYSSHTPAVLTRTLRSLGGGWTSNGRSLQSLDNPVTDAVFSVGARLRSTRVPGRSADAPDGWAVTTSRTDVPPLVTVRRPGGPAVYGRSPFRNQEKLLGAVVYTVPRTVLRTAAGTAVPAPGRGGTDYRVGRGAYTLTAACPARSEAYLWAPDLYGSAHLDASGPEVAFRGGLPARRAAVERLGTAGAASSVRVALTSAGEGTVPVDAIGCLDRSRLASAVAGLKRTGATAVHVTAHGIRAVLPPGSTGTAVIAVPRIAGWSCQGRPADSRLGLLATPVPPRGGAIDCTFRPPGLRAGGATGAGAVLALVSLTAWGARRRNRAVPGAGPTGRGEQAGTGEKRSKEEEGAREG